MKERKIGKTFPKGRYKQAVRNGKVEGMWWRVQFYQSSGKIDPIDVVILQEIV